MTDLRLRYQTLEFGSTDIHLCTLRDNQQYHDPAGIAEQLGICSASWPMFGIIWPSSMVLAHHLLTCELGAKRVLEVGCGIGLSSLLLNSLDIDITATDYHPEAEAFLDRNVLLNQGKPIPFERTDWAEKNDFLGVYDLIIGSDLLYEEQHIELLANFIERHAKRHCTVILVDPGRGRKNKILTKMVSYGFGPSVFKPAHTQYLAKAFKGHILVFER